MERETSWGLVSARYRGKLEVLVIGVESRDQQSILLIAIPRVHDIADALVVAQTPFESQDLVTLSNDAVSGNDLVSDKVGC